MNIALFEDSQYENLLPLTWLRTACELRCGCDRLIDKVRAHAPGRLCRLFVRETLQDVIGERFDLETPGHDEDWCLLNARLLAAGDLALPPTGVAWRRGGVLLAVTIAPREFDQLHAEMFLDEKRLNEWVESFHLEQTPPGLKLIEYPWDLIDLNEDELRRQCNAGGVNYGRVYDGAHLLNPDQIHVGAGVKIKPGAVLDAENGPIHIDSDVLVQSHAVIEGPCHIGRGSIVRPGASIHAGTSIGPVCKVGGEIEAAVFQGYANKQHDGFLGHSFVGEWVNIGASTVTSDLKNTYGAIRVDVNGVPVETGLHFVGSTIGDHAKTGIGTILPTGGVVGVAANVFTHSTAPKFVPSFAWLTNDGLTAYRVDKAVNIARIVMARREYCLSNAEEGLLEQSAELARKVEAAGWRE